MPPPQFPPKISHPPPLSSSDTNDTPLGTPLRQLNLPIRGLVFSCCYNDNVGVPGARPLDAIGFHIKRVYD